MPITDRSEIHGQLAETTIPYDYLVYAVGAETQTFGIKGVKEHACFMKELADAERVSLGSIKVSTMRLTAVGIVAAK